MVETSKNGQLNKNFKVIVALHKVKSQFFFLQNVEIGEDIFFNFFTAIATPPTFKCITTNDTYSFRTFC